MPDVHYCIADTHQERIGKSLCGKKIGWAREIPAHDPHDIEVGIKKIKVLKETVFCFGDIDHWFLNARNKGRLLGCRDCVKVVKSMVDYEDGLHE